MPKKPRRKSADDHLKKGFDMEGYTKYQLKKKTITKVVNGEIKNAGVEKIVNVRGKGAATKGLKFKVRP